MPAEDLAADRQAEPGALVLVRVVQAAEGLEDEVRARLVQPDPVVLDHEQDPVPLLASGDHQLGPLPHGLVLHPVLEEVLEDLGEEGRVPARGGERPDGDPRLGALDGLLQGVHGGLAARPEVHDGGVELRAARPAEAQDRLDHLQHAPDLLPDQPEVVVHRGRHPALEPEEVHQREDVLQRRLQVVARVARVEVQVLVPLLEVAVLLVELAHHRRQPLAEPVAGDGRLDPQGEQPGEVLLRRGPRPGPRVGRREVERAVGLSVHAQRDADVRLQAERLVAGVLVVIRRAHVVDGDHVVRLERDGAVGVPEGEALADLEPGAFGLVHAVDGVLVALHPAHDPDREPEEVRGELQGALEVRVEVSAVRRDGGQQLLHLLEAGRPCGVLGGGGVVGLGHGGAPPQILGHAGPQRKGPHRKGRLGRGPPWGGPAAAGPGAG